jgi:exopolysaccharide production protein ExoQ
VPSTSGKGAQFIEGVERLAPAPLLLLMVFLTAVSLLATPWRFFGEATDYQDPGLDVRGTLEAAAVGSVPRRVAGLALGVFGTLWAVRRPVLRLQLNGPSGWSVLIYWVCLSLSVSWASNPWLTARTILKTWLVALAALAIAQKLSIREVAQLSLGLCATPLVAGLGVEVYNSNLRPWDPAWRLSGVAHPVAQGWNSGLVVLSALALARGTTRVQVRYVWVAVGGAIVLSLTRSRVAFIATLLGAAVYVGLLVEGRLRRAVMGAALVCGCGLLLGALISGGDLQGVVHGLASFGRGREGATSVATLTGRLPLWEECLRAAGKRPLLGYGYSPFLDEDLYVDITKGAQWPATSAHSGYIETLLGLGIVGAGALALVLVSATIRALLLARRSPAYAFLATVVIWLAANLLTESVLLTSSDLPTLLVMACLARISVLPEGPPE